METYRIPEGTPVNEIEKTFKRVAKIYGWTCYKDWKEEGKRFLDFRGRYIPNLRVIVDAMQMDGREYVGHFDLVKRFGGLFGPSDRVMNLFGQTIAEDLRNFRERG